MKRRQRLSGRERFEQVRRNGKCFTHRLLVLCVLPNELTRSRFGFSASKRVGNAVIRNQARRRLREIIRLHDDGIARGWDIVLIARPAIARTDYRQIESAVKRLLQQAGLFSVTATTLLSSPGVPPLALDNA